MYLRFGKVGAAAPSSPDALLGAADALGTLVGFWVVNDGTATIVDGETIMTDISETSARVVKAEIASAGTWTRDPDAPTTFPRCVKTTARGNTNYMGVDAATASAACVVIFAKVETAQGAAEYTNLGSVGTVVAPASDIDAFAIWENTSITIIADGGGSPGSLIPHTDYTGWVVIVFTRDPQHMYASTVGGTWKDLGDYDPGATWAADWDSLCAFYAGSGAARETSSGTVKHAGFMFFSAEPSEADIQNMLIDGGIITA